MEIRVDILCSIYLGSDTKYKISRKIGFSYSHLDPYLEHLKEHGLIHLRPSTTDEMRRDKRTKWFIGLTTKGEAFMREWRVFNCKWQRILVSTPIQRRIFNEG